MLALKRDITELYSSTPGKFRAPLSFYAEPPWSARYLFTRGMTSSVLLQASFACLSIQQLYGSAWMWLWICSHACLYHECLLIPCSGGIKWHDGSAAGGWCTTEEWEFVFRKPGRTENACCGRVPAAPHSTLSIYHPLPLFPLSHHSLFFPVSVTVHVFPSLSFTP